MERSRSATTGPRSSTAARLVRTMRRWRSTAISGSGSPSTIACAEAAGPPPRPGGGGGGGGGGGKKRGAGAGEKENPANGGGRGGGRPPGAGGPAKKPKKRLGRTQAPGTGQRRGRRAAPPQQDQHPA